MNKLIKNNLVMTIVCLVLLPSTLGLVIGTIPKIDAHIINNNSNNNKKNQLIVDTLNDSTHSRELANTPWPIFRHDLNHTGRSQYNTSKNNGIMKWKFATGKEIWSSPVIGSDGTIYIGSFDGKLYALNPNGIMKWDFYTGDAIFGAPAVGLDGTIYVCSMESKLYALKPDGTVKGVFSNIPGAGSYVTIGFDGTIYLASGQRLFALYPNMTKKWVYDNSSIATSDYYAPTIDLDGTIYFGVGGGNNINGELFALYPNGTEKWHFNHGNPMRSSPAISSDGTIYFGSFDDKFYALYPNGTERWNFLTGGIVVSSPAINSDGIIYFGCSDGKLYALYPNGMEKWAFISGKAIESSPAIGSDGTIYFGSCDNNLYALYPNGTKKWNFTANNFIRSSPAIGSDGTIYVGSDDYKLYAIGNLPPPPMNLTARGGNKYVNLTWNTSYRNDGPAIKNYTIYRGTASGRETFLKIIGNVTKYQDKDLMNGQIYFYEVTSNNTYGEGSKSNEANAIPATIPTAPLDLTAVPGDARVTLSWTAPVDGGGASITNYWIYRNGTRLAALGTVLTYTDSGLVNGVAYSYNVSAMNSIGEGPESIGVNATPRAVPGAPRDLQATLGNARIILTWLVPESNGGASITSYRIYRGTISGGEILFVNDYTGGLSWVDTNITLGSEYYYMVSAVNIAGEGPRSNEVSIIPYASPKAPMLIATGEESKIALSWSIPESKGTSITNYTLYRGTTSGGETLLVKRYAGETSWVDINIIAGTRYYYMVSAVNIAGEGLKSNEANATPYAVPNAPTLMAIEKESVIALSWTAPNSNGASIINYSIYRGTKPGQETLFVMGYTGGTSWVDTNITLGIEYYYMVSAVNIAGEGPKSNERNITAGLPGVPIGLTASGGNGQDLLRWSAPTIGGTPAHYNVYRSDSKDGTYALIASPFTTQYRDTGLKNGHQYWYKINAQNKYGTSENTTIISTMPYTTAIDFSYNIIITILIITIVIIIVFFREKNRDKPKQSR